MTDNIRQPAFKPEYTPGPRVLVYKTRKDYTRLVPVILSDDRSAIVAYPHPSDLRAGNRYLTPTPLHKNYLLDNRGIGKSVAFLSCSYEEYAKLKQLPALNELYAMIADKEPLTELYDCGSRKAFVHLEDQLNLMIDNGTFSSTFRVIR